MRLFNRSISTEGTSWDSIILASIKVVTTIVSIVITKILSIGLSLENYGTYSQAILIVSVGVSFLMLGLSDALNYYYNGVLKDDENLRQVIVNTIISIEIVLGIIMAAICFCCRFLIVDYFNNDYLSPIIIIIAIKPMLENIIYLLQVLFVSIGQAKLIALRNLIISLAKVAIVAVSVFVLQEIESIFICLILLDLLQIMVFYSVFGKKKFYINPFNTDFKFLMPIFRFGIPMGIFTVMNSLARDVDKLIIGRLTDTETLAIYTNCSKILPFDIIIVAFATVLMPVIMRQIASKEYLQAELLFKNYLRIGYYSAWLLGAAVFATAPQVICFLYSEAFMIGKPIFICYILDSMIKFASMHLIITASGKTKTLMLYSITTLVINFFLSIALFYAIGVMGPAISTLLTSASYTILILNKSIRIITSKWNRIFDFREILIVITVLAITSVTMGLANNVYISHGLNQYLSMFITIISIVVINGLINFNRIKDAMKILNEQRV